MQLSIRYLLRKNIRWAVLITWVLLSFSGCSDIDSRRNKQLDDRLNEIADKLEDFEKAQKQLQKTRNQIDSIQRIHGNEQAIWKREERRLLDSIRLLTSLYSAEREEVMDELAKEKNRWLNQMRDSLVQIGRKQAAVQFETVADTVKKNAYKRGYYTGIDSGKVFGKQQINDTVFDWGFSSGYAQGRKDELFKNYNRTESDALFSLGIIVGNIVLLLFVIFYIKFVTVQNAHLRIANAFFMLFVVAVSFIFFHDLRLVHSYLIDHAPPRIVRMFIYISLFALSSYLLTRFVAKPDSLRRKQSNLLVTLLATLLVTYFLFVAFNIRSIPMERDVVTNSVFAISASLYLFFGVTIFKERKNEVEVVKIKSEKDQTSFVPMLPLLSSKPSEPLSEKIKEDKEKDKLV